jgi:hypothetical protein
MESLSQYITNGIIANEAALGNPSFVWNGASYPCVPSVSEFKRELDAGGFVNDKLLTMTIQLQDQWNNYIFPNNIAPDTQQHLTYQGDDYRIMSRHFHPTMAYVRITAVCPTRGL